MAETLKVEVRESRGKRNTRRLRRGGAIPAVLYGHGEENICLSVPAEQLNTLVAHGTRLVTLAGAVNESAFVRDVQWDTWGSTVIHVDFTRVSQDEKVQVHVSVELRGEAPGVREGGVVEQLIHDVQLDCPAISIPERLSVNINSLQLHGSITVADLALPEGATVLRDTGDVLVQCVEPAEEIEEVEEAMAIEPEVIGAKEDQDAAS